MAAPTSYPLSQTCGYSARSVCVILTVCAVCTPWVASLCVTDVAVIQKGILPILLGPLDAAGDGGISRGSRSGIIQRYRRDALSNKHLETNATVTPTNSSSRQRTNDRFLMPLETDGSAGDSFLGIVTPPHWRPSDLAPTDPTRSPIVPTEAQQTTTNSTVPSTTISSSTTESAPSATTVSSPTHPGREISLQPKDIYSIPLSSTTSSSPHPPGKKYMIAISSTTSRSSIYHGKEHMIPVSSTVQSVGFMGSTTEVGNIVQTNETEANNCSSNKSAEPPWVSDYGKTYIFPSLLFVSWLFTSVALILHILVPDLRANMGKIFMCYILSLWIKCMVTYSSLFLSLCAPDIGIEKQACLAIAFVSYITSLQYRFWLNIMCFDIWRKVSNLVRLEHVQPVKLLYYHLWGWGMPAMFGLMALLIREYATEDIVKPQFMKDGMCWFEQAEPIHQFLYMTLPAGLLHIANVGFVVRTQLNCRLMQQTSIPETQESNNNSVGRIHTTTNYINEFNLQFRILNFMICLWILWFISLLIHAITELWYFKVIPGFLTALQGLIIFFIFISNNHKRQLIQRKFQSLKYKNCCIKPNSNSITRQQSSSISEPSSVRRKKVSVMSITSLTSLFGSSSTPAIEDIREHVSVQELSSVSSASYNNTSEGGSVHLNLSLNRTHSLPRIEDTQSLNGDPINEVAISFDNQQQYSNTRNTRKVGYAADLSKLTLDPSNLFLPRSISCTYPPLNTVREHSHIT